MKKRIAVLVLAMLMAASVLGGCAAGKVDASKYGTTAIAAFEGTTIYMDELNYYVRTSQYENEAAGYLEYYGIEKWTDEVNFYNILTYVPADSLIESGVVIVRQVYVLCAQAEKQGIALTDEEKAQAEAAAEKFLAESAKSLVSAVNVSEDRLKEIYVRNALANKMYAEYTATIDATVTDEEACQYDVTYIYITADKLSSIENLEEGVTPESVANAIVEAVNGGELLDVAMKDYSSGLTATATTMGDGDNAATFGPTAEELEVGKAGAVSYGSDGAYYVVVRDSDKNEEKTEEKKATMAQEIIDDAFAEEYAEWEAAYTFEPDYKKIEGLVVSDAIYDASETTASAE